jgi:hypothetical protein
MADRYWVGGTATWDTTVGTKWAATSGGAGGQSVPTSSDNVFFDANSNVGTGSFTVTLGSSRTCNNFTVSGLDGAMTLAMTSVDLTVSGSWTSPASGFTITTTNTSADLTFAGTGAKTINTGNYDIPVDIFFNGAGSTWTLASNFRTSYDINIVSGTLNTSASNYSITCTDLYSEGTVARGLTLNGSTVNITGFFDALSFSGSNFTFNAGTSNIVFNQYAADFEGDSHTFYDVTFTDPDFRQLRLYGTNTFRNITFAAPTAFVERRIIVFSNNQTITGTLTLNCPGDADRRFMLASSVNGSQRTLTINSTDTLSDVDFQDIKVLGTASPLTGTRLGDLDNNLNITFAASKTVYWNNPTGGAWKTASWALTSGGTASLNNMPLAQDTAIIEDTGLNSGAKIYAYIARTGDDDVAYQTYVGTIDASSRTLAWEFQGEDSRKFYIFRDLNFSSALATPSSTEYLPGIYFAGRNRTQTFTTGGNNFSGEDSYGGTDFYCDVLNGTLDIIGNFTGTPDTNWYLIDGTLRLNGNTLSTGRFAVTEDNTRVKTVDFGATGEIITAEDGTSDYNSPIVLGPGAYINLTGSRKFKTITGTDDTYLYLAQTGEANSPNITLASSANTRFVGWGTEIPTVNNVDLTSFTGRYVSGETVRCYGNWNWGTNVDVATGGTVSTIDFLATSGTKTITSGGTIANVNMIFAGAGGTWQLQSPLTCGRNTVSSNVSITHTNGTLDLNGYTLRAGTFTSSVANTRSLAFGSTGKIVLTNNSETIFTTSTGTGLSITGTNPLVELSSNANTGTRTVTMSNIGEANAISLSVTSGSDTVGLSTTSGSFKNLNFTGFTGTVNYNNSISIHGNFDAGNVASMTGTGDPQFISTTAASRTIRSNGKTFPDSVSFVGTGATWTLQDAMAVTTTTTLTRGKIDLNNNNLSTGVFSTNTINQTALAFGTGSITSTGTGTVFTGSANCTVTGTPQVILTNSSATSRTINAGAATEANSISFRITAGTGTLSLSTSSGFRNLDFTDGTNPTGYGGAATFGTFTVYGNFKASTNMTRTAGTGTTTFAATSGIKTIDTQGVTFDGPFTFNGVGGTWQLQNNLTSGATRTVTLTNGTLDLNNYTLTTGLFSSTNSNVRGLNFGSTGKIALTGTSGTIFTTGTIANLTVTGNSLVQATNGGAGTRTITFGTGALSEANSINFDITSGSDIVSLFGSGGAANSVNFTGFTGTIDIPSEKVIYGNWDSGSAIATTGSGRPTFAATSGTKTIRTNDRAFSGGVTFSGVGGTWLLSDTLDVGGANSIQLDAGHLNTNSQSVYSGSFTSNNSTTRTLTLGNTEWNLSSGTEATIWNCENSNNLTISYNNDAKIRTNSIATTTFAGGSKSYPELNTNSFDLTITGTNTFEKMGADVFSNTTIRFPAGVTTTINDPYNNALFTGYSPTRTLTLRSNVDGTQATISKPSTGDTVSFDYLALQDINATSTGGQTIWNAGPNSYSLGNVSGWTFTTGGAMMFFL